MRVFLVDDEAANVALIEESLGAAGMEVLRFPDGPAALRAAAQAPPDCVLVDAALAEADDYALLAAVRESPHSFPVIALSDSADLELAVRTMREGAADLLTRPLDSFRLLKSIRAAVDRCADLAAGPVDDRTAPRRTAPYSGIVGSSHAIRELVAEIEKVARTNVSVFIGGESGSGKELAAQALHKASARRDGPFLAVNCGAISEGLQDSELFGHERGAFTGAVGRHQGIFERAHGGTVFLDEVAELSPSTQVRLLRVLQNREMVRVGGDKTIRFDARIVSATNKDLRAEVREGRFREDLFYRLMVYPLWVPPLRDHAEDIPELTAHLLQRHAAVDGTPPASVTEEAMAQLLRYRWPGNVRELENVVRRASVCACGGRIRLEDLPPEVCRGPVAVAPASTDPDAAALAVDDSPVRVHIPQEAQPRELLRHSEKEAIIVALLQTQGRVVKAARMLGLSRATLYRKLTQHDILAKEFRVSTERMSDGELHELMSDD